MAVWLIQEASLTRRKSFFTSTLLILCLCLTMGDILQDRKRIFGRSFTNFSNSMKQSMTQDEEKAKKLIVHVSHDDIEDLKHRLSKTR